MHGFMMISPRWSYLLSVSAWFDVEASSETMADIDMMHLVWYVH